MSIIRPTCWPVLCELAPSGVSRPTVALLTPGPYNSAFFEQSSCPSRWASSWLKAATWCEDHKLYMKTIGGLQQVDVLYRRIDDDFLDPVVFRPDSMLGVPGLTAVLRAGGARWPMGLAPGWPTTRRFTPNAGDDPLLSERGADPPNRRRPICCAIRTSGRSCCATSINIVVKPTGASGGYGVVIGPKASDANWPRRASGSSTTPLPSSPSR